MYWFLDLRSGCYILLPFMAGLICVGIRKFEIGGQRKRISSNAAILNLGVATFEGH